MFAQQLQEALNSFSGPALAEMCCEYMETISKLLTVMVTEEFEAELTLSLLHGWAKCSLPFSETWLKYVKNRTYSANKHVKSQARDLLRDMTYRDEYQDLLVALNCIKTSPSQEEYAGVDEKQNDSDEQTSQDDNCSSAIRTGSPWDAVQVKCASDY